MSPRKIDTDDESINVSVIVSETTLSGSHGAIGVAVKVKVTNPRLRSFVLGVYTVLMTVSLSKVPLPLVVQLIADSLETDAVKV